MIFLDSQRKMPLMTLPVRSVLLRLKSGRVLISPGSGLTADQLSTVGPVTDIVAPNLLHCAGIAGAFAVFPSARLWGAPGVLEAKPEIPWTGIVSDQTWPYSAEIEVKILKGLPSFNEMVFYHLESKTLIVTDLVFNLVNAKGWGARIILGLFGTYRRFAISRLFMTVVKDRVAFESSLREILNWPFENIVMAHGEAVIGNGRELFLSALKERGLKV